jgi:nicotinamide-nucleotide amidase
MDSRIQQLVEEILQHAKGAGLTIATAESCTAGALATEFAKGEAAAQHYMGGFITYTKDVKTILLGVPADLLAQETAVSANVAAAMARGAVMKANASIALAITGVTGDKPDEDGNPVGLVYCAAARTEGAVRTLHLELRRDEPEALIRQTMEAALGLLRDFVFA